MRLDITTANPNSSIHIVKKSSPITSKDGIQIIVAETYCGLAGYRIVTGDLDEVTCKSCIKCCPYITKEVQND